MEVLISFFNGAVSILPCLLGLPQRGWKKRSGRVFFVLRMSRGGIAEQRLADWHIRKTSGIAFTGLKKTS
jgi:hypothetical protein